MAAVSATAGMARRSICCGSSAGNRSAVINDRLGCRQSPGCPRSAEHDGTVSAAIPRPTILFPACGCRRVLVRRQSRSGNRTSAASSWAVKTNASLVIGGVAVSGSAVRQHPRTGCRTIEAVAAPNGLTGTFSAVNTFFLYGAEANCAATYAVAATGSSMDSPAGEVLGLNESLDRCENLFVVNSANPDLPARFDVQRSSIASPPAISSMAPKIGGDRRISHWPVERRRARQRRPGRQHGEREHRRLDNRVGAGVVQTTMLGGLLAQSTNIGSHTRGRVAFVEEIGLNLGYQFTNHIRGFVGYNFLYRSNVVGPPSRSTHGQPQPDPAGDRTKHPGPAAIQLQRRRFLGARHQFRSGLPLVIHREFRISQAA